MGERIDRGFDLAAHLVETTLRLSELRFARCQLGSQPSVFSFFMFQTGNHAVPVWAISFLNAEGQDPFGFAMNLLQTLIYGGLVLWAWVPTSKKRKPLEDLLAVTLLGGFILFLEMGQL